MPPVSHSALLNLYLDIDSSNLGPFFSSPFVAIVVYSFGVGYIAIDTSSPNQMYGWISWLVVDLLTSTCHGKKNGNSLLAIVLHIYMQVFINMCCP